MLPNTKMKVLVSVSVSVKCCFYVTLNRLRLIIVNYVLSNCYSNLFKGSTFTMNDCTFSAIKLVKYWYSFNYEPTLIFIFVSSIYLKDETYPIVHTYDINNIEHSIYFIF